MSGDPVGIADLETLATGLYPGRLVDQEIFWHEARDVLFQTSGIRPSPGIVPLQIISGYFDDHTGMFDAATGMFDAAYETITFPSGVLTGTVKGVHQQKTAISGETLVAFGTDSELGMFDREHQVVISYTNLGGISDASEVRTNTLWSFEQWGNWVIATNGVDKPKVLKYPGTTSFVDLANYPADYGKIVRRLGPKILFFNTSDGFNQILGSKDDDPETWDPLSDPTAIELTVRDFHGEMIAAEPLGDTIAVYGDNGMHIVSYGGPFLVTAKKALEGIKAVSSQSIVANAGLHYGIEEAGIFVTDGVSVQRPVEKQFGHWLNSNVNWREKSRITGWVDRARSQISWAVPLTNGSNYLVGLNYVSGAVSLEPTGIACGARTNLGMAIPIIGMHNSDLRMLIDAPVGRIPYLMTRPIPLNNRFALLYIEGFMFRLTGEGLRVRARFADSLREFTPSLTWVELGEITDQSDPTKFTDTVTWVSREAAYVQFQFFGEQSKGWRLTGIDLIGSKLNAKRF